MANPPTVARPGRYLRGRRVQVTPFRPSAPNRAPMSDSSKHGSLLGSGGRAASDGVTLRALLAAGVFGFGFSGLVDVLVLHHVLQWHHLVSGIYPMDTLAGLRTNILADGLFSLAMLVLAGIGAG